MEKEFVPFELAVKLKELGFDEPCLAHYIKNNQYRINKGKILLHVGRLDYDDIYKEYVLDNVPLYQQAFDWFWDKYEMWGEYFPWNPQINNWKIAIFYKVNGEYNDSEYFINGNLNEARQALLNKLIEIVENEQNNLKFY